MQMIRDLVSFAIKHPVDFSREGQAYSRLNTLVSMGTWQDPHAVTLLPCHALNHDRYLGLKDRRLETYIAQCAMDEVKKRRRLAVPIERRIAVLGSSMNPITCAHLDLVKHFIDSGEDVLLIPAAQSLLKSSEHYEAAHHRYEMARLALAERVDLDPAHYQLSSIEMDRDPPSRMFMTLCVLILHSKPWEQFTLMLTLDDNFNQFSSWYRWSDFGALCAIKFYTRPGIPLMLDQNNTRLLSLLNNAIQLEIACATESQMQSMQRLLGSRAHEIQWTVEPLPTQAGSSTMIRQQLRDGASVCPDHCSPAVFRYAVEHGLYCCALPRI